MDNGKKLLFRCWVVFVPLLGLLMIGASCGSSNPIVWPSNQSVYVSQENQVDSFPISSSLASNGNVAPATALTGSNTTFNDTHRTAFDASGRLYETDADNNVIDIYPAGSTGNTAPTAQLTMACPYGLAIDASDNLYISERCNNNVVFVVPAVAANASGTLPSVANCAIIGANTTLNNPNGVAVNSDASMIWVANENSGTVLGFARPAGGFFGTLNLAPSATITNTVFGTVHSVAVDSSGNVYVTNEHTSNSGVYVYASTANGAATPKATIVGSKTGFDNPNGISLDSKGNIYVGNNNGSGQEVLIFKAGASGNVAPDATISGANTGITNIVHGVTVGPTPTI